MSETVKREAPNECPVCSAELNCASPETETECAEWEYDCGAIIHRKDGGRFYADANCPKAMREAIDVLNMSIPND